MTLAANGAVASASSASICCGFSTTGAINGNNRGPWGNGDGWNDATPDSLPDWFQVDFAGSKTIDEIDVYSLHDNYTVQNTPTESQTFTLYGLLNFEVQYWNGSAWVTVPGGSVTGNNKVWRKFTFAPITTSKIRVWITSVPDSWSRIVEVEAWTPANANINWLVTDHLGTPRMIIDQTGSLANMKRHDYLPFGEELFAPAGGRSTAQGYASGDGVRQQFTAKERDVETGLDYFVARYYSIVQGRFTSIDTANADLLNPQSFNKYRYGLNNPLRYIDPDGRQEKEAWYKPVLDYLRTIFGRPGFNDPESPTEPPAPRDYSPMGLDKNTIIRNHFKGLVIGSRATSEVISTLDPTGASDVVKNFMEGSTKGAVVAGVLALPNLFGVDKAALTSGEFLVGKLGKAEVGAQFSKSGDTLVADVVGTYGARNEGLGSTTRALFASIMGFAKEEGLKQVRLSGVAVINEKLEKKMIKNGWQLTKVKVGDETATAYTKTFEVK